MNITGVIEGYSALKQQVDSVTCTAAAGEMGSGTTEGPYSLDTSVRVGSVDEYSVGWTGVIELGWENISRLSLVDNKLGIFRGRRVFGSAGGCESSSLPLLLLLVQSHRERLAPERRKRKFQAFRRRRKRLDERAYFQLVGRTLHQLQKLVHRLLLQCRRG